VVHKIEIVSNGPQPHNKTIRLFFDSTNAVECDLEANVRSILSGAERNNPAIVAQRATDWLQMLVDAGPPGRPIPSRSLLTVYAADDPARLADPGLPNFFWARVAGTIGTGPSRIDVYRPTALVGGTATHIIARAFLVTFTWDGSTYNILTSTPDVLR
jgi:hypothetical protein